MGQTRLHVTAPRPVAERVFAELEWLFEDDGFPLALLEVDEARALHEVSLYVEADRIAHVRAATPNAAHARAVLSYYRSLVRQGPGPAAAAPRRPLLYLHGARDGCIDRRAALVATGALPDGSRVEVVPGAGHFVPLEQPAVVARAVLAFVARAG